MTERPPGLLRRLVRALVGPDDAAEGREGRDGNLTGIAAPRQAQAPFQVTRDDLLRACTREEIELHELAVDPLGGVAPVPFGHLHSVWRRFVATLEPGDVIWRFSAHRVTACGVIVIRSGYVAVRHGQPQRPMVALFRSLAAGESLGEAGVSDGPVVGAAGSDPRSDVHSLIGTLAPSSGPVVDEPTNDGAARPADGPERSTNTAQGRRSEAATVE